MFTITCGPCETGIQSIKFSDIYKFLSLHDHNNELDHGNINTYRQHFCRCDKCRKVNRDTQAKRLDKARTLPVPKEKHGTLSGHTYYGCRCVLCYEVFSKWRKEKYEAKKDKANARRREQRKLRKSKEVSDDGD